jgi:transcriptional regulator with GAF, ATPase, and Fis domain
MPATPMTFSRTCRTRIGMPGGRTNAALTRIAMTGTDPTSNMRSMVARSGRVQFDLAFPAEVLTVAPPSERTETVEGYVTAREFRERERQNVLAALVGAGWRIYGRDGAAARLGIKPTTLASRTKTLGIARPGSRSPG